MEEREETTKLAETETNAIEKTSRKAIDALLEVIPEEKKEIAIQALSIIKQEYFEGPIPHPKTMRGYEDVLAGSADRILKMAEEQQEHRIYIEKVNFENHMKLNRRGQIFGFIIFILGIILSVIFALLDMKTFAGIFATGTVVIIVSLFVTGTLKLKKLDYRK